MKSLRFPINCSDPEFADQPATYKIAAEWIGGGFTELKTFGFANEACLERVYAAALDRLKKFPPSEEESLSDLHIYEISQPGGPMARPDLELKLRKKF